jgi:hypothetical protein
VILSASWFTEDKNLGQYQAANKTSRPLNELSRAQQEKALYHISRDISSHSNSLNERAKLDQAMKRKEKDISLEILDESISNTDELSYPKAKSGYELAFGNEPSSTRLQFYEKLNDYLGILLRIVKNQVPARDQLYHLLLLRFDISDLQYVKKHEEPYEETFEKFHKDMNKVELGKFDFIHQITQDMAKYNFELFKLLDDNKNILNEELWHLHDHLQYWLAKYRAKKDNPDMCLVYTGGDEEKAFPTGIHSFVSKKIEHLRNPIPD